MRATAVGLAIVVLGYVVVAASASALEPGVFVSPGSPAGKEYSLPLPAARGQAVGRPTSGSHAEPLFGVGITPSTATRQGTAGATTPSSSTASSGTGSRGSKLRSSGNAPRQGANSKGTASGGTTGGKSQVSKQELASLVNHGSAVPQVALWGGLVLLGGLAIGGLLAFVGRRRSS